MEKQQFNHDRSITLLLSVIVSIYGLYAMLGQLFPKPIALPASTHSTPGPLQFTQQFAQQVTQQALRN